MAYSTPTHFSLSAVMRAYALFFMVCVCVVVAFRCCARRREAQRRVDRTQRREYSLIHLPRIPALRVTLVTGINFEERVAALHVQFQARESTVSSTIKLLFNLDAVGVCSWSASKVSY